jgi:tricorn protease
MSCHELPLIGIIIMLRFAWILLITTVGSAAIGQEPIRFARTPDISPDGKQVVFSYLGDIWTVEAIGGVARPVTMHEAHDYFPTYSPDSRQIAFSSNRHGGYDVFVVPVVGGKPKRLTFDSAADIVQGWTPDGKSVVFASARSPDYPGNMEIFTVPVDGGAEKKVSGFFEAKELYFSPSGGKVAYVSGPGSWSRRGYRGSSNDDLFLANADGTGSIRLTTFEGQDLSPMWSPDGNKVYYVTENGAAPKCTNIVVQDLKGTTPDGPPRPIATHSEEMVRRSRMSRNGEWIVYECGSDLWVTGTKSGGSPRKLAIEVHADDKSNTETTINYTKDATEFALSPEERHAVLVVHGQLFLTKLPDGGKTTRLTEHASADHSPVWAPDGQKILFSSDRTGVAELYLLESDDPEHPALTKSHKFKTKQLTNSAEEETNPQFNPKGDRISFIRGGQLWWMKPDGTELKLLVADKKVLDYEWSPDGKWVAYSRMDGSFASELYLVPADQSKPAVNVSRYATYNADMTWGAGKIAFISQRRGTYAVHILPLQKPAIEGTKPDPNEIDFDDIHQRILKPANMAVEGQATISADGTQVAFSASSSGTDLWVASTDGKMLNRITTGNQQPHNVRWGKRGSNVVYFLNGAGELRSARTGLAGFAAAGEPTKIPFTCKLSVKREEEFAEMFAQCWRILNDQFYDDKFHGADWKAIRTKYAPIVPHCANREDLYSLVSLMLGELNASHLGISGRLPTADEQTADLGLIFDQKYAGPGLKIVEVLKRGPADKRGLNLKAGDYILQIDRVDLTPAVNLSKLLNGKAGEGVQLTMKSDLKATESRKVEIIAAPRDKIAELMCDRWVEKNSEQVSKQSGGKLGYIHIPGMDEAGLEVFVRSLYSDNFDKEGIILDVRNNGGGFTHDQVLNYLSGKEHTRFVQRDGGEGGVLRNFDRKWTKPITLLINNRSYSDAEIFPHAFRTAGLGKIVGQSTGGLVIGTSSTRLIDGSTFRIPRIGVYRNGSVNMDKEGVPPDVAVAVNPEDWARGIDTQIAKAIEVLSKDVVAWKANQVRGATVTTAPKSENRPVEVGPPETIKPQDESKPAGVDKGKGRRTLAPRRH